MEIGWGGRGRNARTEGERFVCCAEENAHDVTGCIAKAVARKEEDSHLGKQQHDNEEHNTQQRRAVHVDASWRMKGVDGEERK